MLIVMSKLRTFVRIIEYVYKENDILVNNERYRYIIFYFLQNIFRQKLTYIHICILSILDEKREQTMNDSMFD